MLHLFERGGVLKQLLRGPADRLGVQPRKPLSRICKREQRRCYLGTDLELSKAPGGLLYSQDVMDHRSMLRDATEHWHMQQQGACRVAITASAAAIKAVPDQLQ